MPRGGRKGRATQRRACTCAVSRPSIARSCSVATAPRARLGVCSGATHSFVHPGLGRRPLSKVARLRTCLRWGGPPPRRLPLGETLGKVQSLDTKIILASRAAG